jgi:protein arginine kinase
MTKDEKQKVSDAWYTESGRDQDVVLSTKSTLVRNLANFPFPRRLDELESERVMSIVFDSFNFLPDAADYQMVSVGNLDGVGNKIMRERDVLSDGEKSASSGLVLRNDGKIACTINNQDHLHIESFSSGCDLDSSTDSVYAIDGELQKHVQFAASYEFGYLSQSILNSGSGLILKAKVHLPSISALGSVKEISSAVLGDDFDFSACYGISGGEGVGSFGGNYALGSYYFVRTKNSCGGTEVSQIMSMKGTLQNLIREERNARKICRTQKISEIINFVYRSLALAKTSLFVNLREAVEIVSGIKFGLDMEILSGVTQENLHALLYRIQEGHLEYVLNNGKFKFEKDIQDDRQKKIQRLRALILQEAFENIAK